MQTKNELVSIENQEVSLELNFFNEDDVLIFQRSMKNGFNFLILFNKMVGEG